MMNLRPSGAIATEKLCERPRKESPGASCPSFSSNAMGTAEIRRGLLAGERGSAVFPLWHQAVLVVHKRHVRKATQWVALREMFLNQFVWNEGIKTARSKSLILLL